MNYSRAIRLLRAVLGISQQELAQAVDLSSSLLSRIEAGERKLSKKNKDQIASALKIPNSLLDLFAIDPGKSKVDESEIKKIGEAIIKLSQIAHEKKTSI
ncbi:MAG: helix-turn-helix transcriptional regulator [Patescibacteria group bacterium]